MILQIKIDSNAPGAEYQLDATEKELSDDEERNNNFDVLMYGLELCIKDIQRKYYEKPKNDTDTGN